MKKFASIALIAGGLALLGATPATAALVPDDAIGLLAVGERTSVLTVTTGNNTNSHNGSGWYYRPGYSIGFVFDGAPVTLNTADTFFGDEDWSRLSWHLYPSGNTDASVGYIAPGWRYGGVELYSNTAAFQTGRFIYTADTLPAYYPSGPQENVDVSDLDGWTLCWSNLYSDDNPDVDALDDVWAACDGAYLMLAGGAATEDNGGSEGLAPTGANSGGILVTAVSLIAAGMIVALRRRSHRSV